MELREGQSLKYNGSDKISKISKIDGDVVYFTDNSRATIDVVRNSYSDITKQNYQPMNESVNINNFQSKGLMGIAEQLKNYNGGSLNYKTPILGEESGYVPTSVPFKPNLPKNVQPIPQQNQGFPDLSGLTPETQEQVKRDYQKRLEEYNNPKPQDPFFNQFNDSYTSPPVQQQVPQHIPQPVQQVKKYEHNSKLPKMRKTQSVKISIIMNEMIPKLDDIRAINTMFEDVSIIEELGKEIAFKYINEPELLENLIIADLENKIKGSKKRVVRKK